MSRRASPFILMAPMQTHEHARMDCGDCGGTRSVGPSDFHVQFLGQLSRSVLQAAARRPWATHFMAILLTRTFNESACTAHGTMGRTIVADVSSTKTSMMFLFPGSTSPVKMA